MTTDTLEESTDTQQAEKSLTEAVWDPYQMSYEQYPDDQSLEAAYQRGELRSLRSFRDVPTQGAKE